MAEHFFQAEMYEGMTAQIVHDVFATMLRYQISATSEEYRTQMNQVTSAIFLAGAWQGAVLLECSEDQALFFTGRLMGIPKPDHMDDDTRDAMGEVVNMIGGNLKAVLPPGVALSIPSVLEGPDYAYRICGSHQTARFSFHGDAGTLWVAVVQVAGKEPASSS